MPPGQILRPLRWLGMTDQRAGTAAERLVAAGLDGRQRDAKADLFARALDALGGDGPDVHCWWVPGRVEFLGKHTDYAGGRSLLCAAEQGFAVVARPRVDERIQIRDALRGESATGELSPDLVPAPGHWSNYPLTVARRVARNFPGARWGVDLAFASDLPPAAGMSSSSALIVATFLALSQANGLPERSEYRAAIASAEDLAGYLGAVENGGAFATLTGDRGVGTSGGSEDHTAILCARPGSLVQYRFAPVHFERAIPFPADHVLVIAASGVTAEKTGNALEHYQAAAARAAAALRVWRGATGSQAPTLAAALGESPDALARMREVLRASTDSRFPAPSLIDRVEQFQEESAEIIPAAADALALGDLQSLGALVDRSQANAERWLGNQVPETKALARSARELGATAASAFGAGFGGSVYALVRASEAEPFMARWSARYLASFAEHKDAARFFVTRPGPAARQL